MNTVRVRQLGIGACCIESTNHKIYVDAFNNFGRVKTLDDNDILLFTHDDADHFSVDPLKEEYCNNRVIAPPSVTVKLLENDFPKDKILTVYPPEKHNPIMVQLDGLTIHAYQTDHFIDWNNIHISFLLELNQKRIFITGDSYLSDTIKPAFTNASLLIYSLIRKEVVKGEMNSETGTIYHLAEINDIFYRYNPQKILCNHLMNCDWAVRPQDMKMRLAMNGVKNAYVLESSKEDIVI